MLSLSLTMKTFLLCSCAFLALTASASAEIIGVEQFDYPDGAITTKNGGTFWDYKNFTPTGHTGTASTWDNFTGAPAVTSGRLVTNNTSAKREYNGTEADGAVNDPASAPSSVAKTVYYRVTFTTGATLPSFISISSSDFGTDIVSFGVSMDLPNDHQFSFRIHPQGLTSASPTLAAAPNTTYTLVTKLDYQNNIASLYLNPNLNALEGTVTPVATNPNFTATNWSTAVRLASGTGGSVAWDDLVVATTWHDLGTVVTTTADNDDGSLDPAQGGGVSLREAVNHSYRGSLITFDPALSGKTITLTRGQLERLAQLTIDASSLPLGLTVDGNNATRLFQVTGGFSLTLRSLTLTGGNADSGGAVINQGAILRLLDCTLTGNHAQEGGAIFSNGDTSGLRFTEIVRCTVTGNTASVSGGGVRNFGGQTFIKASTISGNTAPASSGGGIASDSDFTPTTLSHTIVSGNTGSDTVYVDGSVNSFVSQGHNLIGTGNAVGNFIQTGDQTGVTDPKLSPLGYFGGPTMTMHPLVGSPAIDAGSSTNPGGTDQRGLPRFVDGDGNGILRQDIGSVEAGPLATLLLIATFPVTTAADEDNGGITPFFGAGTSLREAIKYAPDGSVITFASGLSGAMITLTPALGEIVAGKTLFIDASNLSAPVTVSGNNASRVFNIAAGASVAMHHLVITNGRSTDGVDGAGGVDGTAGANGGGILNAGSLSLFSCAITNNAAGDGGNGGNSNNPAKGGTGGAGGGIFSSGPLILSTCVLSGNVSGHGGAGGSGTDRGGNGGAGGGIFSSAALNLTACTLSGNNAGGGGNGSPGGDDGPGGGIFSSGTLSLTACTLFGNFTNRGPGGGVGGSGGGIYKSGLTPPYRLTACTLADNITNGGVGGGLASGHAILQHCLLAGNVGFNGPDDVQVDTFTALGANLLTSPAVATNSSGAPIIADPLLAPLGHYGGPTQTMALLPGSPARNAGAASTRSTDQRGFPIVGTADLGAYEAQIGPIADVSLIENETPPTQTFPVGQIGTLTASSSNTLLVPEENIVITGTGASRSVTVTPAAGQFGTATITLTENLHGEQQTFQIQVTEDTRFIVTSANDDSSAGTLRAALALAASTPGPNTIRFDSGVTNISLASEFIIDDPAQVIIDTIVNGKLLNEVTLNGRGTTRHFRVFGGSSLTLRGLFLTAGLGGGYGGSIYSAGTLILERCKLISNHSNSSGGAIASMGILFRAADCTFAENTADGEAGGVLCYGGEVSELTRCTISGNGSTGLVMRQTSTPHTVILTQCTVANNSGSGTSVAGGIASLGGILNLSHCTISENNGSSGTGGLLIDSARVSLSNCIIAANTANSGEPADISFGSVMLIPQGANLIGSNQSVEDIFPAGPLVGTAAAPRDPALEGLNLFGGTTFTMPPRPGSPALDQSGVLSPALTTDQRGRARPLGLRPDLGAVEADIILVTTAVDELDNPGTPGTGVSLREAVRDVPTGGTVAFDRALFTGATATTNTITLTRGPLNPARNCTLNGSANPGGMTILTQLVITQQPQSLSVASGAAANFAIIVTDISNGVAYQWRKNGTANGTMTAALNFAIAQESHEGVYDVNISELASAGALTLVSVTKPAATATSQPASLIVDGSAVAIKRQPANAMIALNSSHTLSVIAAGPGTLTYQWTLNGKNISGATKASYLIAKAALTNAGTYRCAVKSGATTATSDPAEIGVVDTTPKTVNLLASATASFTATVNAAGNGITFAWLKNGAGTAFNTKIFVIKPALITDSGLYTCTVTGLAGTFTGGAPTTLNVSNAAPSLVLPLALPAATIGQTYFFQLPVTQFPGAPATSFSIAGALPTGLVFNTTNGILSGRPTVTKTGGYTLSFKAINAKGSSAAAAATLAVNVVPPNAVGVFAGPIERSPLNDNLGGRFDLTTTAAGSFSGSLTLGARAKLSFTAQLLQSAGAGDVILYGNIPGLTMSDKTPLTAYIEVFAVEQLARLTLIHPNGTTLVIPAWRNQWVVSTKPALNNPASIYAAYYTMRLDPQDLGTAPRGYGYASFTVKPDGTLTLAGKLPDGSDVTGGTFVGPDGHILIFNLLYANRGSHVGQFTLTPASPVTNNAVSGATSWFKPGPLLPTSTDTVYKDGFGPLTVTAAGGVYVPPAKGLRVMGLLTVPNPNAKLSFTLGGLTIGGAAPEFTQFINIVNPSATGLTNTAVITAPITNTTKVTTLTATTGLFAGSFQINGATTALNRPAPFFGQIVKIGATTEGYGYFLLPTVPVPPKTVTTSPKQSGRVVLGVP